MCVCVCSIVDVNTDCLVDFSLFVRPPFFPVQFVRSSVNVNLLERYSCNI